VYCWFERSEEWWGVDGGSVGERRLGVWTIDRLCLMGV